MKKSWTDLSTLLVDKFISDSALTAAEIQKQNELYSIRRIQVLFLAHLLERLQAIIRTAQ
jgi:hypothetical protein